MTREKKPAAHGAARGSASLLTGALLLATLTGCSGDLFQKGDTANANMKAKPAVALAPVQGVPDKYASKVNDQFATLFKANGVQIVDAKDAVYTVKPIYTAQAAAKRGTKLAYTIDVTDKAGNKVRTIAGEEIVSAKRGGDYWRHVSEDAVQKVAMKSATDVNAWIENPNAPAPAAAVAENKPAEAAPTKTANAAATSASAPVKSASAAPKASRAKAPVETASLASAVDASAAPAAAPTPAPARPVQTAAASHEIVALVPAVSGAPGDGKSSLSDAMKKALARQGVKVASGGAAGSYKIQGQVELGAVANGQQPITIRWVVIDPAGKQMEKTVVQNNKINAGSLDGAWGEVAEQAAGAAANEVSKLLSKNQAG